MKLTWKKAMVMLGGASLLLVGVWVFLPYDRDHLIRVEAGGLSTTYNVWAQVWHKDWQKRDRVIGSKYSGGISLSAEGKTILGRRVAFEMKSQRIPNTLLYVTDQGLIFADDGQGPRPVK